MRVSECSEQTIMYVQNKYWKTDVYVQCLHALTAKGVRGFCGVKRGLTGCDIWPVSGHAPAALSARTSLGVRIGQG